MRLALALLLTACASTATPAPVERPSPTPRALVEPTQSTPGRRGAVPLAITIDDLPWVGPLAPGDRPEAAVARILEHLGDAPVVGFFTCHRAGSREAAWNAWLAAPIGLGNHTRSHRSLDDLGLDAWREDVASCQRRIEESSGRPVPWFRYPFLRTGSDRELRDAGFALLGELGLRRAPVTVDVSDWALAREYAATRDEQVAAAYVDHVRRSARRYRDLATSLGHESAPQVLLLHANALAADHLGTLLAALRRDGFRFVTLEEAMAHPMYAEPDRYVGAVGLSWLYRISDTPDAWAWDAAQLHAIEVRFGARRERASLEIDARLSVRRRDEHTWTVVRGTERSLLTELDDGALLFVGPPTDDASARSLLDWTATRFGPRRLIVVSGEGAPIPMDHATYVSAGARIDPTDPSITRISRDLLQRE